MQKLLGVTLCTSMIFVKPCKKIGQITLIVSYVLLSLDQHSSKYSRLLLEVKATPHRMGYCCIYSPCTAANKLVSFSQSGSRIHITVYKLRASVWRLQEGCGSVDSLRGQRLYTFSFSKFYMNAIMDFAPRLTSTRIACTSAGRPASGLEPVLVVDLPRVVAARTRAARPADEFLRVCNSDNSSTSLYTVYDSWHNISSIIHESMQ